MILNQHRRAICSRGFEPPSGAVAKASGGGVGSRGNAPARLKCSTNRVSGYHFRELAERTKAVKREGLREGNGKGE